MNFPIRRQPTNLAYVRSTFDRSRLLGVCSPVKPGPFSSSVRDAARCSVVLAGSGIRARKRIKNPSTNASVLFVYLPLLLGSWFPTESHKMVVPLTNIPTGFRAASYVAASTVPPVDGVTSSALTRPSLPIPLGSTASRSPHSRHILATSCTRFVPFGRFHVGSADFVDAL